jgi:hypothetical protein
LALAETEVTAELTELTSDLTDGSYVPMKSILFSDINGCGGAGPISGVLAFLLLLAFAKVPG